MTIVHFSIFGLIAVTINLTDLNKGLAFIAVCLYVAWLMLHAFFSVPLTEAL